MDADGVNLHAAAIGKKGAVGIGQRYHVPLRVAFLKLRSELDRKTPGILYVQRAVFSINARIGTE